MALQEMVFQFDAAPGFRPISKQWSHTGVVGSGDMEALIINKEQGGKVTVKVVTPVVGFDAIWEKVLQKFVADHQLGNLDIEINDNNATPFIVAMRLKQAIMEAEGGEA